MRLVPAARNGVALGTLTTIVHPARPSWMSMASISRADRTAESRSPAGTAAWKATCFGRWWRVRCPPLWTSKLRSRALGPGSPASTSPSGRRGRFRPMMSAGRPPGRTMSGTSSASARRGSRSFSTSTEGRKPKGEKEHLRRTDVLAGAKSPTEALLHPGPKDVLPRCSEAPRGRSYDSATARRRPRTDRGGGVNRAPTSLSPVALARKSRCRLSVVPTRPWPPRFRRPDSRRFCPATLKRWRPTSESERSQRSYGHGFDVHRNPLSVILKLCSGAASTHSHILLPSCTIAPYTEH